MKNKIVILLFLLATFANAQIITIDEIRNFDINANTIIKKDGVIIGNQSLFEVIGVGGFKMQFRVGDNVNPTISQGTLSELNIITDISGPITATNPLTILEQKVFTTSDTVLEYISTVSNLVLGDEVTVSGTINKNDNSMQLSRLELDQAMLDWKLRGFARNISAIDFTIGDLTINKNGITATNCTNGFVENAFVEIKAMVDATYSAGQPLTTLSSIVCQSPDVDQDSNNTIPVVLEGMVSKIIDLSSFEINDLVVFFDANTGFDNGESEHIDLATKLEVQGLLDTNTRFITASTIRFVDHRVKFITPVLPSDIVVGESITVFGQQVNVTPQTRDDNFIVASGIAFEKQVEVRGFVDSDGKLYAQRIKDKGTPDSQNVKLRGDVTSITQPTIEVNGVTVDASLSDFELSDGQVDINTFFAAIQIGMQVKLEEGSYDLSTGIVSMGVIELVEQELDDDPDTNSMNPVITREVIGVGGVGLATVTRVEIIEQIFSAGFE